MSGVSAIRTAIANTIATALPNVAVSSTVDSLNQLPAILVQPSTSDFETTLGRGTDKWMFDVYIVCSRQDEATSQALLDGFISGAGSSSIRQILFQNSDVGLPDTTVVVTGMKGYGGHFKNAGIPMVGAVLTVKAYTSGIV